MHLILFWYQPDASHLLVKFRQVFKMTFKVYLVVHVLPVLLFKRKQLKEE